jgi:hypothetical protein
VFFANVAVRFSQSSRLGAAPHFACAQPQAELGALFGLQAFGGAISWVSAPWNFGKLGRPDAAAPIGLTPTEDRPLLRRAHRLMVDVFSQASPGARAKKDRR